MFEPAAPTATPAPNQPPSILAPGSVAGDQGIAASLPGIFADPDDTSWSATVDYGDGSGGQALALDGNTFALNHEYARAGSFAATLKITDAHGNRASSTFSVSVAPRKVIFVQGIESESRCPDGAGLNNRAPAWLAEYLARDSELAAQLAVDPSQFVYFSYSGRYCGGDGSGGEAADYRPNETCSGVAGADGAASRLRALVERLAPSKVTILGHSMGGLAAAYLAGEDPAWARKHIASVVTFDSPLRGVPRLNLEVLRVAGAMTGGCPFDSHSISDMQDGNTPVMRTAAGAAQVIPFYNLDATDKEGFLVAIRQAVPGDRTKLAGEIANWSIAAGHSQLWEDPPFAKAGGPGVREMVACGLLREVSCR